MPVEKWKGLDSRVLANTAIILSFLKKYNIKATFFVLGWIAEQYPNLIEEISGNGHDIGYHSYYHRLPKSQAPKEFEKDLKKGLVLLENIIGKKILYYRAPNFSLKNKWMLDCLVDNGIKLSSSIKNPILYNGINLPNKPFVFTRENHDLFEFPLVTRNLLLTKFAYSGSGYFRLLPVGLLKSLLESRKYQMLYFHPRDFDHNVPTPKELGFIRNTLNRVGTTSILPKLEKLTNNFSFISISQALENLDLDGLERIEY